MPQQIVHKCQPVFSSEDADLNDICWCSDKDGYARATISFKTRRYAHTVVLERVIGRSLLKNEYCDHIDGNRLDNRRSNLRVVTWKQNCQNRKLKTRFGYRGVHREPSGRFLASVKHNYKKYYCGIYDTAEEAADAATRKRRELGFLE